MYRSTRRSQRGILILTFIFSLFFIWGDTVTAQNLTINNSGQTGTSGTNWSTSGTNPITITFSGTSNIHKSVIEGYLNSGIDVIISAVSGGGDIVTNSTTISKTQGSDATLTLRARNNVFTSSITSTAGKLNVIIWVEYDGDQIVGPSVGPITTNGGHIWIGGGSGTAIWNGLTVGNSVAFSNGTSNMNAIDLVGNLTTNGGDVLVAADGTEDNTTFGDFVAWNAARTIDAGSGDISLLTEKADFSSSQGHAITLITSGTLTIAPPNSSKKWPGTFSWQGTMSGTTFTGQSSNALGLIINNYTSLSAVSIGTYLGTGVAGDNAYVPVTSTEVKDIQINSAISTSKAITIYGLSIYVNANLTTSNAIDGDIYIKGAADIIQGVSDTLKTNGADVVYWADFDGNGGRVEVLSGILTAGGNIWIGGGSSTETQNGLTVPTGYAESVSTDKQGVLINGANINSSGGTIRIKGLSDDTGNGVKDLGTMIINSNISSGSGNLSLYGTVNNDLSTGSGLWLGTEINSGVSTGNVTLSTTSGNIYIEGVSAPNNTFTWAHGLMFFATAGDDITISSTTGSISFNGNAVVAANYTDEAVGLVIQMNNTSSTFNVNTDGGAISLTGNGGNSGNDFGIGIRANNIANSIKIGDINTGKINFSMSSLQTTAQSTIGVVSIETSDSVLIEPISTSFGAAILLTDEYSFASTIKHLGIGKTANNADVTINCAINIAGSISTFGGNLLVQQNLTSSLASAPIVLKANGYIEISSSKIIQTNGGAVTISANSEGTATSNIRAIYLATASQILTNGGNITLGGGYSGTEGNLYAATNRTNGGYAIVLEACTLSASGGDIKIYGRNVTSYGDGVFIEAVNISTTGSGSVGIFGDSYGGYNGTTFFGGITFENLASIIQTVNGNLTLAGILTNSQSSSGYGINFYRTSGSAGQTRHIQLLSQAGNILITGDRGTSIGGGIGHSSWGNIYIGSPASNSFTASGNITLTYSKLVNANSNGFKVKTTGAVVYQPTAGSFDVAQTFPPNANYVLADGASRLTIGKSGNTANITIDAAQTIGGPIIINGGNINVNANLTSTATTGMGISLNGQKITHAEGVSVLTSGSGIEYLVTNSPWTYTADVAIAFSSYSGARATVNAQGGNVTINASFATTGINNSASHQEYGITVSNTDILTNGTGTISINGDIYNNASTTGQFSWGVDLRDGTVIRSASGAINITGRGGKTLANSRGVVSNTTNVQVLSNSGSITFNDLLPTGNANYTGMYFRSSSANAIKIGADGSLVTSSTSNITFNSNRITFDIADIQTSTSGKVFITPEETSFATTFSNTSLNLSSTVSELSIGKIGNNSAIGIDRVISITGPITAYGGTVNVNNNITSTLAGAPISLYSTNDIDPNPASTCTITTNNGNVTVVADADSNGGGNFYLGGAGIFTINSGSGNITLRTEGFSETGLSITSTGSLTIEPSDASFGAGGFTTTWINLPSTLTGLTIGKSTNTNTINFGAGVSAAGPITAYANIINLNSAGGLTTTAANAGIYLYAKENIDGNATQTFTTSNGNVYVIADSDSSGAGTLWFDAITVNIGSGNLIIKGEAISFGGNNINGTGTVTIEPSDNAFGGGIANNGLSLTSTITGLTIGKTTNNTSLTFGTATTISGPITAYGGDITINENLNTTTGGALGDVMLKGTGNISLASTKNITTSGGDVTLWSDGDGNGSGYIRLLSSGSITSNGGNIFLGGGSDINTGYARGSADVDNSAPTGTTFAGVHLNNGASLSSGGGNITLRGQNHATTNSSTMQSAIWGQSATVNSGTGKIAFYALAGGTGGNINAQGISRDHANGTGWTIRSSNSSSDAIRLEGDATSCNGTYTSLGINFAGTIEATGVGGGIIMVGKAGTANVYDQPLDIYGNILASSGPIEIIGENNNSLQEGIFLSTGATFGFKAGTNVTSSSSNIIFKSSNTKFNASIPINTSGTVSILPLDASNSFGIAQALGSNILFSANVSGLTVGKSTNTADITFGTTTNIAGPITAYGGLIQLGIGVELISTSATGNISLQATNGFKTAATSGTSRGRIMTSGGNIHINADTDNNNSGELDIDWLTFDGSTGDILLEAATYNWNTGSNDAYPVFFGTGALTIRTVPAANYAFNSGWISLINNKKEINFGRIGNTADVNINHCSVCDPSATNYTGKTLSVGGPITLRGGNVTLNMGLTATNNNITIEGNTAVTQTQPITSNGLSLVGAGTFTLNNTSNNVTTIAAGTNLNKIGNLSYTDASGGLTIGNVNNPGIYSTGTINIETLSGDITLSENMLTTNTTSNAIKLFADKNKLAGDGSGGNIIGSNNASITVGTGGTAMLYAGKYGLSTGLRSLLTTSYVRYNVDATTSSFSPAIGAGIYGLFREGPFVWNGGSSANHNSGTNWQGNSTPPEGSYIQVSPTATNNIQLNDNWNIGYLDLPAGKMIDLNGYSLTITGALTGVGKIKGSTTSSLIISGGGEFGTLYMDQTTNGNTNALQNFTVDRTNQTVTIADTLVIPHDGTVTPTAGTIATGNKLKLLSNLSGTGRIAQLGTNADITGDVILQRYIVGNNSIMRGWRMMSIPTTNNAYTQLNDDILVSGPGGASSGFDIAGPTSSIRTWQESTTRGWASISNINNTLSAGKGALVFFRGDRTQTASLTNTNIVPNNVTADYVGPINKGNIAVNLDFVNDSTPIYGKGFNLLGNPYPSQIDWENLSKTAQIDNYFWVWNPVTKGYVGNATGTISSGQAFFVRATQTAQSVIFEENDKTATSTTAYFKNNQGLIVKMNLDSVQHDIAWLKFLSGASKNYVFKEDGLKLANSGYNITFITNNNVSVQHNIVDFLAPNQSDTFVMQVNSATNSAYSFSFDNINQIPLNKMVFLKDLYSNSWTDLRANNNYAFTINNNLSSTYGNRFLLIITDNYNPLPVHITAFKGERKQHINQLSWNVAQEKNIAYYQVQRSINGNDYTDIGVVKATNSSTAQLYLFNDENATDLDVAYYRLKVKEQNGNSNYSNTVVIHNLKQIASSINVYPIPTKDWINIETQEAILNVKIHDVRGKVVAEINGQNKIDIGQLRTGVYIMKVETTSGTTTHKIIKE